MSCGGGCKGGGCNRPREEMTVNPAALQSAVKSLFAVAATGFKNFPWPTEEVANLADLISNMLAENERLKALLGLREPGKAPMVVTDNAVRIAFGPDSAYTLVFPAQTAAQRKELASTLAAAVAELRREPTVKPSLPGQLPLPFDQ